MPVYSADGTRYNINYTTDASGFRFSDEDWKSFSSADNLNSGPVVLVIGDSFVGDAYTSDHDAWFAYLQRSAGFRVYACGIGGSGTYQQLLAIRRLIRRVDPSIVILQSCTNDHANNDPSLIFSSNVRNQELRRPYLSADGNSFWASGWYPSLYRALFSSSQLFAFLDNQLAKRGIVFPYSNKATIEKASQSLAFYGGSPESLTEQLLRMFALAVASHSPSTRLYGVLCQPDEARWWPRAFSKAGFTYVDAPLFAVESAEKKGAVVRVDDGAHWNIEGNRLFGQQLASYLQNHYRDGR